MLPERFEYQRASSVDDAISRLSRLGDGAKLLAGGHSLIPLMKLRLVTPGVVVDIGRLSELRYIHDAGDHIAIGSLTRHYDLQCSKVLQREVPLLAHVAGLVGDPPVRHRGTIGGSLAHGDPASDLPAAVMALDGRLVVSGSHGKRTLAATDFFRGFWETALTPEEVLTEVQIPKGAAGWAYEKFTRRAFDWAIVGVAVVVTGTTSVQVALANVGPATVRASATEQALRDGASPAEAAGRAVEGLSPSSDVNASSEYRAHLAVVLTGRALERALA